jgi:hypothetical protein
MPWSLSVALLYSLLLLQVCYMTDNKNKECVLYLRNRMGIVKMAALNGVAIIPTFTFNQVRDICAAWGWGTYAL